MRTIQEWQKVFTEAANKKFPVNEKWSEQDRLLSIIRQLADVSGGTQKEQGIFTHTNKEYNNPNHRIAALIADILILGETRGMQIESELEKVLEWYLK